MPSMKTKKLVNELYESDDGEYYFLICKIDYLEIFRLFLGYLSVCIICYATSFALIFHLCNIIFPLSNFPPSYGLPIYFFHLLYFFHLSIFLFFHLLLLIFPLSYGPTTVFFIYIFFHLFVFFHFCHLFFPLLIMNKLVIMKI